jgi:hypothetical protein
VNCGHNVRSTVFIEARSMYRPRMGLWRCAPLRAKVRRWYQAHPGRATAPPVEAK